MLPSFRVKVCGITSAAHALNSIAAGADALGLNFYPASPRYIEPERAREIVRQLPASVVVVGVFVNESVPRIQSVLDSVPLAAVQLHGDESPEVLAELPEGRVLRAIRVREAELSAAVQEIQRWRQTPRPPVGFLVDAWEPGRFGGTGAQVDWSQIPQLRAAAPTQRLILAGGLKPENVARAIAIAGPDAVDVASGVESGGPGCKSPARVMRFAEQARAAWRQLDGELP